MYAAEVTAAFIRSNMEVQAATGPSVIIAKYLHLLAEGFARRTEIVLMKTRQFRTEGFASVLTLKIR